VHTSYDESTWSPYGLLYAIMLTVFFTIPAHLPNPLFRRGGFAAGGGALFMGCVLAPAPAPAPRLAPAPEIGIAVCACDIGIAVCACAIGIVVCACAIGIAVCACAIGFWTEIGTGVCPGI
jgi:hypothetical protein